MISPEALAYVKGILLLYGGTHCHFGELAKLVLQDTIKSTVVFTPNNDPRFVLWTRKDAESAWNLQPHTDLLLPKVRNMLWNTLEDARFTVKTPPEGWAKEKWQGLIQTILEVQEKLLDHAFMKHVLEELIILVYSPDDVIERREAALL